mmetsp:Transcript_118073/g.204315  ORF Transcript_118073/g.204315 Transcript_118073/m.204315 type:complete len:148 (-) Transcript_118073:100-543(-)
MRRYEARMERVLSICADLGVKKATLNKIESDSEVHPWDVVLPWSTLRLLHIARGLIADAEVLLIHKPLMGIGPNTRPKIASTLRKFVDNRGLELDPKNFHRRRPRTCIISVRPDEELNLVDQRHWPVHTENPRWDKSPPKEAASTDF